MTNLSWSSGFRARPKAIAGFGARISEPPTADEVRRPERCFLEDPRWSYLLIRIYKSKSLRGFLLECPLFMSQSYPPFELNRNKSLSIKGILRRNGLINVAECTTLLHNSYHCLTNRRRNRILFERRSPHAQCHHRTIKTLNQSVVGPSMTEWGRTNLKNEMLGSGIVMRTFLPQLSHLP